MSTNEIFVKRVERKISSKHFFLNRAFSAVREPGFTVQFWDGRQTDYGSGRPQFTIRFTREPALRELFVSPSLYFGEACMRGEIELDGSYKAMARALESIQKAGCSPELRFISKAFSWFSSGARSMPKQKEDIAAHYDLGNDFFSLWLDKRTLSYSCAYFQDEADTLATAQQQKIALVLRKLRLGQGMRLLDIGCGWGGLALAAAGDYGAKVLAITLSEEQAAAARQRFDEHGLSDRCEVRLCNYMELDPAERFDRVVSVGMFEHVGKANYRVYFDKVHSLLKSGGLSLLHTLTKKQPGETDPWITKRIFPGGRIPAVPEVVEQVSRCDFCLLHVESLRCHYVKTLDAWYDNFSRNEVLAKVNDMFGQAFIRMWSLYLQMASAFLAIGELDVHQFVFSKNANNSLPLTAQDIYA